MWALRGNRPRYLGVFTPPGELLIRHGFWPAPLRVEGGDDLTLAVEHTGLHDSINPLRRKGGLVPSGQAYIVGNGDREVILPSIGVRVFPVVTP